MIERLPNSFRYRVTEFGLRAALFFTRLYNRIRRPGLAAVLPSLRAIDAPLKRAFVRVCYVSTRILISVMTDDGTIEQPFLVWVCGLRGPEPQKWYELNFGVQNWRKSIVLAWPPLSLEHLPLPIDDLAHLFPPEKCLYNASDLAGRA